MNHWIAELQQATRTLARTPVFASIVVGMLGIAISVTVGAFSVVDKVLLERLPHANPERLVYIAASAPGSALPAEFNAAPEFFIQYQEQSKLLEDISTSNSFTTTVRLGQRVERARVSWPTNSLFSTLGATPVLGRLPVDADENRAVVISDAMWADWFARDPAVVGRTLSVSGLDEVTVIGVMGPQFRFPNREALLWVSSTLKPSDITEVGDFDFPMIGRIKPGVSLDAVADELTALARRAPERFGSAAGYADIVAKHRAVVRPLADQVQGATARPLWVLLGATAIVLLIACANVTNLFLVRTDSRHRELAVRRALGASRVQLLRLQLAETLVVALLAGVLAVVLVAALLPLVIAIAPAGVPRLDEVVVGANTLLIAAALTVFTALLCGALPAWRAASPDLTRLHDGGRSITRRQHGVRNGLVIGQTALALILLIGAGLLLRSAWEMGRADLGYDTTDIFTFQIAPDRPELKTAADYARFNLAFLDRLAALPGVQSVGLINNVPLNEQTANTRVRTEASGTNSDALIPVKGNIIAGDTFGTMGISVQGGRPFNAHDHATSLGNVIVSRSAAELLWPGNDPLGERLQRGEQGAWETVVGVVEDVLQDGYRASPEPVLYFPMVRLAENGGSPISSPAYVIRTPRADSIAADVRALVREVAPEAPIYREYTIADLVKDSMVPLNVTLVTLGIAATLALLLGSVGLYGVLSCIVAERTREIGVRMALGARATDVRALVVGHGARVLAVGVGIGLLVAMLCTRALGSLLYGVHPIDAMTFIAVPIALAGVGLLASYLPARRASNLDPMVSLRRD